MCGEVNACQEVIRSQIAGSSPAGDGVEKEQLPLKDAPGSLPAPVGSASRKPSLPPQKPKVQPAATAQPAAAKTSHTPPTPKKPVASLPPEESWASGTIH
jgi:hypothetical protein